LLYAGIDPMAGVIHAGHLYLESFVYDIMEAIRPDVDVWLLEYIQNHTFIIKDLNKDGGRRLTLKITPQFAETALLWSEKIDTIIKQVEGVLLKYQTADFINHPKLNTRI
jgi:CRISPR/Cas system-associated endonuclease Cas1